VEADFVETARLWSEVCKTGCHEKVSLVDIAHTAFGKLAPVPVFVDDEARWLRTEC
jgi:hypothetical protein